MIEHRDCAAIDEMLPAYAVNGLDDADRALVEAHLSTCERHEDAATWGDVALRLADLAPERATPDELRARILAIPSLPPGSAEVEVPTTAPVIAQAPVEDSDPVGAPVSIGGPRLSISRPYALAAAFAALALFFAGWTAVLLTGGDDEAAPERLAASTSAGGIEASATYIEDEEVVLIRLTGLTPLPEGSDYQLWAVAPGEAATPAGIVRVEGGSVIASVPGSFEAGWTFAVTIEPAGGSPEPTSDRIVAVTF